MGVSPIDILILMWHIPTELSLHSLSQSQSRSRSSFIELLPRVVIFLIVKLRRVFSQLSFVYVLFSFNIFLITYFRVMLSFEPPLNLKLQSYYCVQFWTNSSLGKYQSFISPSCKLNKTTTVLLQGWLWY